MLTTVALGVTVAVPVDEMVIWCSSAEARGCFPGARNIRGDGTGFHFEVAIRAPGAAPALVTVDEYLKGHGREPGGSWFETSQVWMWPNRQAGTSWHRYRLRGDDEHTDLDFTWRYLLPGLGGAQVANTLRFGRSIERAAEIYVERLAQEAVERLAADPAAARRRRPHRAGRRPPAEVA